ncbi:hypothetical protein BTN99_05850 [Vibrio campbellii]|nr:hypothetical protein BTN99_05850 [Vibrio campbellii]
MKLSKCPKCDEPQKALTLLLINNMTNKKCHQCGCTLDFNRGASGCFYLLSIVPLFFLMQYIEELGVLIPLSLLLYLIIGSILFIKLVPLIDKDKA